MLWRVELRQRWRRELPIGDPDVAAWNAFHSIRRHCCPANQQQALGLDYRLWYARERASDPAQV